MDTTRRAADMKRQKRGWVYSTGIAALMVGTLTLAGCGGEEEELPPVDETAPEEYEPAQPTQREPADTEDEPSITQDGSGMQEPMPDESTDETGVIDESDTAQDEATIGTAEEPTDEMPEQDGDESGFVDDESGPMSPEEDEELN